MSLNLCIDWGNTLVKAGLFQAGELTESFSFAAHEAHNRLTDIIEQHKPSYAIISSVSSQSSEIEDMLASSVKKLVKMDARTPLPIMNAYSSDNVGTDRLAMAVGAHFTYPGKNNLVVCFMRCETERFS